MTVVLNNILNEISTLAKKSQHCYIPKYSSNERVWEGSGRIAEDLGKVQGGGVGNRSSGSNRICGTKYHNPKDKF